MTKEEFLDKKNIEIIREVKEAMDLKSEIDSLTIYLNKKVKNNTILSCSVISNEQEKILRTKYMVHNTLVRLVEMIDKGELVLKEQ